jgi:hypothetical protein
MSNVFEADACIVRNNSQNVGMHPVSGMEPESSMGRWFGRIVTKVRQLVVAQVPEGYQDERGFHFGRPNNVERYF